MTLPLAGVRVTDFCWVGAGAYMTRMIADLGADVIKIESTRHLDSLRLATPFANGIPGVNRSGYFADRNSSKRSLTVDVKTPEGLAILEELVGYSDIVSCNFSPGTLDRMGLGYDRLRAINPRIVLIEMSVNGAVGPQSDMIGYGSTISALTGLHHLSGLPGRLPVGTGTNYPDHVPNPGHGALALLAALRHVRRTGEGQRIDLAQTEPMLAMIAPALMDYAVNGRETPPRGNQSEDCAPRGAYRCAGEDRWLAVTIRSDAEWRAFGETLGLPEADIARWTTLAERMRDQDAIDTLIAAHTSVRDTWELVSLLQAAGIAAGEVQHAGDLIERDSQLRHRGHWQRLDHPEVGKTLYNGLPFAFETTRVGPRGPAPLLGQHTDEVLRDLIGMDEARIARLREDGVLS